MKSSLKNRRNQTINFGVIGVGGMGLGHCDSIAKAKNSRLTAVCDIEPSVAEKVGRQFNVPFFQDTNKLIKSGLCDAVVIATPHPSHVSIAIECMRSGLHVISEKPLSETVSTADKMVRAARQCRVAFAVMFQRRFESSMAKAMEIVASGQIGNIYRTCMISPEFRTQAYYDSGKWRATWAGEGGGVMMNQSPHIIDMFIQLGGMPSAVYGRVETRMHRIEVEDQAEALLKYPGGATGYLYCSTNEFGPGQMIEVFGDKGKLVLRNGELTLFRFKPGIRKAITHTRKPWDTPKLEPVPLKIPVKITGHFCVIQNMARHLLYGERLVTPGASGIDSLELANAITLSSHLDKWVKLPLRRANYDALLAKLRRESKFVKKGRDLRVTDPRHKA